jgi:hypothetical protein
VRGAVRGAVVVVVVVVCRLVVVVVVLGAKRLKNLVLTGVLAPHTPKKMSFSYVGRRRHTIPSSNYYYYLIKFYTFVTH